MHAVRRYWSRTACWSTTLLLCGLVLDFGGGFGVKALCAGVALWWTLTRTTAWRLWRYYMRDVLVLLVVPVVVGLAHWAVDDAATWTSLGGGVRTVSGHLFILFAPLITLTRPQFLYSVMRRLFRFLSVTIVLGAVAHYMGVIDLGSWSEWATKYGVGYIGLDPRQMVAARNTRFIIMPRIAQALPIGVALDVVSSLPWAIVLSVASLLTKTRALAAAVPATMMLSLWASGRMSRMLRTGRRVAILVCLVLAFGLATLLADQPLLLGGTAQEVFARISHAIEGRDGSTLTRLEHLRGYSRLVEARPWTLLVGAGPGARIYNARLDQDVALTEMPLLNLALWYGVPYSLLYLALCLGATLGLWRLQYHQSYCRDDAALVAGSAVFWITSSLNPLMTSPIAVLMYATLRARSVQIRQSSEGSAAPSTQGMRTGGRLWPASR